jgi:hypothetical protein
MATIRNYSMYLFQVRVSGHFIRLWSVLVLFVGWSYCWFGQAFKIVIHTRETPSLPTLTNRYYYDLFLSAHVIQKYGIPFRESSPVKGTSSVKRVYVSEFQGFLPKK